MRVLTKSVSGETMELIKNVKHSFDLSGMELGDQFLGCIKCNIQYDKNAVAKPECFNCKGDMKIYYLTRSDFYKPSMSFCDI